MNEAANFCNGPCSLEELENSRAPGDDHHLRYSRYGTQRRRRAVGDTYQIHNGNGELDNHALPVNLQHANGMTEFELHNTYGLHESQLTNAALRSLKPGKRPFILTRSTWVGSGRTVNHWLGDNDATWEQMWLSLQGILQFQLYGVMLVGGAILCCCKLAGH